MANRNPEVGHASFIFCKSTNVLILLLAIASVSCNPPFHHGRRINHHPQLRCHDNQYEDVEGQKPKSEDVIVDVGPKAPDLEPQIGSNKKDTEVNVGDLAIKIFPINELTVVKTPDSVKTNTSCAEGFGIHKPSGKCYKFSRHSEPSGDSPCGNFMEFYQEPSDPMHGDCDCKQEVGGIVRPIIYHGLTDSCYWQFDQGPCKKGEWLIMDEKNVPSCSKRSCAENLPEDWSADPSETTKRKFWFRHRGKCYQTGTQAYCENPRQKAFYETSKQEGYVLRCKEFGITVKALLNGVKELPCAPGHKKSISGDCSRVVTFE